MPTTDVAIVDIDQSGRYRKDIGELRELCQSIEKVGLLQPIVLTKAKKLVAGARRIAAYERMGHSKIKANIVDNLDDATLFLRAEQDENTCRKEFTPSEKVAIGKALEELERPKAKERQQESGREFGRGKLGGGKFTQPNDTGKTRDKVAAAVGMSGPTYEAAKQIVDAAEESPEEFAEFQEEMDSTGRVWPAFKKLQGAKQKKSGKPRGSFDDTNAIAATLRQIKGLLDSTKGLKPNAANVMRVIESARDVRRSLDKLIERLEKGAN